MSHVMIDIETLGTTPGCVVLSIGAAVFSMTELPETQETFYSAIKLQSCVDAELTMDPATVAWWAKQPAEARAIMNDPNGRDLAEVLADLKQFMINARKKDNSLQLWANDPDFDLAILTAAFNAVGETVPWNFYEGRSVRTILYLAKELKKFDAKASLSRLGTYHNALDDVMSQITWVGAAWRHLS